MTACGTDIRQAQEETSRPDPTALGFRLNGGFETVALNEVFSVTVRIDDLRPLVRTFTGIAATRVVRQLNLHLPREETLPASLITGHIVVGFRRETDPEPRFLRLAVQRGRVLQDEEHPEVVYRPLRTLDRAWLAGL